jgi:hypothetical protein
VPARTTTSAERSLAIAVRAVPGWAAPLALALLVGAVLRVVWVGDMEYKVDEAYMFHRSQAVGVSEPWPWVGQASGVGLRNPGLSVWVFVAVARVFSVHDPTSLDRTVQLLNVAALLLLAWFVLRWVPGRQREPWLWATALVALSPPAILLSRKIWAQSVLPFFSMLALLAWWRRGRRWAAFAWGVLGAALGQIHMSGFFFAAGLALWTALFDRRSVRWRPWLAGTLAGSLTLIPWLAQLGHGGATHRSLANLVELRFWRLWVAHPLALDLRVSFGPDWGRFLASPHVGGGATYGVALAYAAIVACAVVIAAGAARAVWPQRRRWRALFAGGGSSSGLALSAALWGFGGLLTLTGVAVYRHYLLVAFALPFLSLAWLALLRPAAGRRALAVLCVAQALLGVQMLAYLHVHHGARGGDYGVSYDAQRGHGGH